MKEYVGKVKIGVIGGSGVYEFAGGEVVDEIDVPTPFGNPSDKIVIVRVGDRYTAFLPRHAKGHKILPTDLPVKANIWALKWLGVEKIIAISAVGSLKEEIKPMDFVIPTQLIDFTRWRRITFFGEGVVGHVSMADPFCPETSKHLKEILEKYLPKDKKLHFGKTYINIEGPQFSSRAESHLFRSWGADVIGMTAAPEAKLAREAEICYALIAMSTDYDCWYEGYEDVTADMVLKYMSANVETVRMLMPKIIEELPLGERKCVCANAAQFAIVTNPDLIPPETKRKLWIFYKKYWEK